MAKRLLAGVLWKAANERLCPEGKFYGGDADTYSCNAVANVALKSRYSDVDDLDEEFISFFQELGCDPASSSLFNAFQAGKERQGARYLWLLLAMHVAEDEGITV